MPRCSENLESMPLTSDHEWHMRDAGRLGHVPSGRCIHCDEPYDAWVLRAEHARYRILKAHYDSLGVKVRVKKPDPPRRSTWAFRIRRIMSALGIDRATMASWMNIHSRTLQDYLNGNIPEPKMKHIRALRGIESAYESEIQDQERHRKRKSQPGRSEPLHTARPDDLAALGVLEAAGELPSAPGRAEEQTDDPGQGGSVEDHAGPTQETPRHTPSVWRGRPLRRKTRPG